MIGFVECEYMIFHSHSLKEKRAVLQRTLTRLRQKFNVSAAEVDHQDSWQLTTVAMTSVSSSRQAAERELNHALSFLDSFPEWERVSTTFEWL
ncbi:DUF503 family protein [Bacillus sp. FJAT-49711]|uniref:DUF503 domain-containing protein n=1 Tax=Bacillus sp. FJAT-49711 TaxID=2833585 RepID=UPI001BC9EA77|nr:DUF503 family protein [Bacillus sp. FJAT-49711]MBS4217708.1 DUF503 family protein [Bacillus sp. FJAT-49711]